MNKHNEAWDRLIKTARKAPDSRDYAAPSGFATRVAAHAFSGSQTPLSALLARFSWRALGVATLLMAVTLLSCYRYSLVQPPTDDDPEFNDSVAEILELTS